jgi:hypothetical protein
MQGPVHHSDDADDTGSRSDAMSRRDFVSLTAPAAAAGAATLAGGRAVAPSRPDAPHPQRATARRVLLEDNDEGSCYRGALTGSRRSSMEQTYRARC